MAEEPRGFELGELAIRQLQELIRQRKHGDGDQDMRPRHQKRKLPPWLVYDGAFEFTLTTDMSGGVATASLTNWWGVKPTLADTIDDVEYVLVYDTQECFPRALTGAQGFALVDTTRGINVIIECQSKAGFIEFVLAADKSGSSAVATVTRYWGTQSDIQNPPVDGSSQLTVYDEPVIFPRALNGAKGIAALDVTNNKYRIVQCQQLTTRISGTLDSTLSAGDASFTEATYTVGDDSPFNQSPTGTLTIYNVFGWDADAGALFKAEWNKTTGHWELYQVEC